MSFSAMGRTEEEATTSTRMIPSVVAIPSETV